MENRKVTTAGKITQELIVGWLIWKIVFGLIYSLIFRVINLITSSLVLKAILSIILQGIITYIVWKISIKSAFKNKTIDTSEIGTIMRNLIIFTIAIFVIIGAFNFYTVNKTVDQFVSSNPRVQFSEKLMSTYSTKEELDKYEKEKEKIINDAKKEYNTYLIIIEIGLAAAYLAVLPLVKKEILDKV